MSEIALYRKYRPGDFKEVVGQEHVVSVLEAAVKKGSVSHAYLFSGSRGTGKTSIARIFARALKVSDTDVIEIDAASNRGIDEIRELREGVHTLPFESDYKVYIIDEVHMLTTAAFNALLKTLEEPPSHVIFILATTEFHKLPETIISRCQTFNFKKPTEIDVKELLTRVAKAEKAKLDKDSLNLIALLADGSYRDALGVLQKVTTLSTDATIEIEEVEKITGAPRAQVVQDILKATLEGDLDEALSSVRKVAESGVEMTIFLRLLMRSLRYSMLLSYTPAIKEKLKEEASDEEIDFFHSLGKTKNARLMSGILKELLIAYEATGRAHIKELPLELALVKLIGEKKDT